MEIRQNWKNTELWLLFACYLVVFPRTYMEYDMGFWRDWAVTIHKYGLSNAYKHGINYFPVYLYCLYIYDVLQGTEWNIVHHINNIKVVFIFFDFLPLFVISVFRDKIFPFKVPWFLLLLNVAYIFNSMVWGQIDSIYTNLSFLAILAAYRFPVVSVLLYTLALNTKPQAIEFAPILLLLYYRHIKNIPIIIKCIASALVVQLALFLPFLQNGTYKQVFYIAGNAVDLYNKLSICAFNFWYIVVPGNPYFIDDRSTWLLFTYKSWGLLLFCISLVIILLSLRRLLLASYKDVTLPPPYRMLFLSSGMLALCFFYFNSQMHERYANPIIIFFFFYGVTSGNYKLYVLSSIPYFLSLDKCFPDYLPIVHYKIIFASRIIALWYTATVVYGFYLLKREHLKGPKAIES